MYNEIITDLVIYSNAFIERHPDSDTILRHDPATSTIMAEMVRGNTISKEVAFMKTKDGREIPSRNLTHLAVKAILSPPFGESPYGFWFADWQSLKLIYQERVKKSPDEITEIKKRIVDQVVMGAGMDPGLFDDASRLSRVTTSLLKMDAQFIQGKIIDKIERQMFPFILKSDPVNIPQDLRFQIEGYEE
ncbi:MAG: hypothetical protein M3115_06285 [Thermoproteota archaeon]|nr:hypothetical protein [Thermoproteota archaeon]